jgi:pimeloyl-ACP methyl ester carboxylesterase
MEDKALLKLILIETDRQFLKFALRVISTWKNDEFCAENYHIHGTNDHVLPLRVTEESNQKIIPSGGHLMILDKTTEIQAILSEILQ